MKPFWQPMIPMRWRTSEKGPILQQAWGLWKQGSDGWFQTNEYRWEDVPMDIEDPKYWSKEDDR